MPRSPILLGSTTEPERALRAAGVRITLGATMLLAPGLGRRIFGVPADQDNGAVRLMARMWGIRQVVLGTWALRVQDRPASERRLCYQLNAVVDVVDVAALGIAGAFGTGLRQAAVMGSAFGVSETLAWMDLADQSEETTTEPGVALA
jgi:hypothetical protein